MLIPRRCKGTRAWIASAVLMALMPGCASEKSPKAAEDQSTSAEPMAKVKPTASNETNWDTEGKTATALLRLESAAVPKSLGCKIPVAKLNETFGLGVLVGKGFASESNQELSASALRDAAPVFEKMGTALSQLPNAYPVELGATEEGARLAELSASLRDLAESFAALADSIEAKNQKSTAQTQARILNGVDNTLRTVDALQVLCQPTIEAPQVNPTKDEAS